VLIDVRRRIQGKFPKAKFVTYSAVAGEQGAGARLAFGRPLEARHQLARASVILALDSDFIADGPEQLASARAFSQRRAPGPDMNRLYVAEPALSVTGSVADHRLRLRGSDIAAFAAALARELAARPGFELLAPLAAALKLPSPAPWEPRWLDACLTSTEGGRF